MTVSQRRIRTDPGKPEGAATEPGIKYTCDCCGVDITHTVRIKCAAKECEEVDLCPMCFSEGKETQKHKAWHDYKVIEQHSQPIFSEDWGADEELLLVSGLILHGLGNWLEVASHIGTRTKEECEKHYKECYLGVSVDDLKSAVNGDHKEESVQGDLDIDADRPVKKQKRDFMPRMDMTFDIDPDEFQQRKKARIEEMRKPHALPAGSSNPLVSAPTNHEVAGFMPGRLEFEHEVDNEAEMVVKDFDFGLVWKYGGDEQPQAKVTKASGDDDVEEEEEEDGEGKANEAQKNGKVSDPDIEPGVKVDPQEIKVKQEPKDLPQPEASSSQSPIRKEAGSQSPSKKGKEKEVVEPEQEVEDDAELEVKLALLDIYFSKLDKREEAKDLIFDRGLTEYKRIQANERKRPKEERELIHRYKVFAKLQTAQDFEVLVEGLVYEQNLRKRILELQEYRRMGITTGAEAEAYDTAKAARAGYRPIPARNELLPTGARVNQGQHRHLYGPGTPPPGMPKGDSREPTPRVVSARKPPTPLNLANSAALDLLSLEEQSLCSSLRVLPKPYLSIKETFVRENERRRGLLKRRDARRMLKIDVNKSGRIFDFLVSAGMLVLAYDPTVKSVYPSLPVNGKENGYGPVVEVYPGGQRDERMEGVNGTTEVLHR